MEKIEKTELEWRAELSEEEFNILRKEATEAKQTSPLNQEKRSGVYLCAGCGQPLFKSETKYNSGSGWPSFFAPLEGALETKIDRKLFRARTEYHCSRCGGHQGHVFDDGPAQTGKRYCNNGIALKFIPEE